MADTLVTGVSGANDVAGGPFGPFWISTSTGAIIYLDGNSDIAARRCTDGVTYGSPVMAEAGSVVTYAAWFDRETPGNTGTLVHVVWIDDADDEFKYATYDVSDDSWSSVVTVDTGKAPNNSAANNDVFVTVTRSGNIVCGLTENLGTQSEAYKSSDGTSFSTIANPWEADVTDGAIAATCNTGDDNDAAIIFWDRSANALSVKVYDDSANTWTETAIVAATDGAVYMAGFDVATRLSDGHAIVTVWNAEDNAAADLLAFDLNISTVSSVSVTALTDVLTDSDHTVMTSIFVDQTTDDLYASYAYSATAVTSVQVFYKKSTDGGTTWGTQTTYQEDAGATIRCTNMGAMGTTGGRLQPLIYHDVGATLYINVSNEFPLTSLDASGTAPSGVGGLIYTVPPPIVTGGTPPYTYSVTDGMLPDGVTLDEDTGVVSGTTTTPGSYSYTLTVTDADGNTADVAYTILVAAAGVPFESLEPTYESDAIKNKARVTRTGGTLQEATNDDSIATYGERLLTYTNLANATDADAMVLAESLVDRYGVPVFRVAQLVIAPQRDDDVMTAAFGLELLDRITVNFVPPGGQTPETRDCFVIGIHHSWQPPAAMKTTLSLMPADVVGTGWRLGVGELGDTTGTTATVLAY